jgi:hypothetical protein
MPLYLAGLGWVAEAPAGNRLRWSLDFQEISNGRFLGLPARATVERALIHNETPPDTGALDDPPNAAPVSWWENLGDLATGPVFPPRIVLPKPVQALRFQYQGPPALMRVYDNSGAVALMKPVAPDEQVRVNGAAIRSVELFAAPATLHTVQVLDLFSAAHAAGLVFQTIATLAPRATAGMSRDTAWKRYGLAPSIDEEDWATYQTDVLPAALASTPQSVALDPDRPPPWEHVEWLMAPRWEHAVVHGMGFVDGPGAAPGTSSDAINAALLLPAIPNQIAIYRVTCTFSGTEQRQSNLLPIRPMLAAPLAVPLNPQYVAPEVRLFDAGTYTVTAKQRWQVNDRRAIGVEVDEQIGKSPILKSPAVTNAFMFRTREVTDPYPEMSLGRRFDVAFYDVPLQFRARSIDGWDRVSGWSALSPQVTPAFIHNPQGPPLHSARHADGNATLIPKTPLYTMEEWAPDHAVAHTPGSVLEVLHRNADPSVKQVDVAAPKLRPEAGGQLRRYGVPVPGTVAQPEIYVGGALVAGAMRAEILAVEGGELVFESIEDSSGTAPLFEAGPAVLQQAPNHPDLFAVVAAVPAVGQSGLLVVPHALPPPSGKTAIEHYAWRVRMGTVIGSVGNVVPALRRPSVPAAPPPFSVELLGVDYYDRTLVRVELTQLASTSRFSVFWAPGAHDAASFTEAAAVGGHGAQRAHHGRHLYELFPLPIPKTKAVTVTFGLRAVTEGGFASAFTLLHFSVPTYAAG